MDRQLDLTAKGLLDELKGLPLPPEFGSPAELIEDLPNSHALAICQGALNGMPEDQILAPLGLGGNAFDITPLLADLANLATLVCGVIAVIELSRSRGKPTADEVLAAMPPEQRQKPQAQVIVVFVLSKSELPALPTRAKHEH